MRIVLVDDHSLFAEGLKTLLADLDPRPEVSIYRSCEEALQAHDSDTVELILLDYYLSGISKLKALDRVRRHFNNARIVVVSAEENSAVIRSIIDAGAAGFIPKSATYAVLTAALKLVAAGETYLPSESLDDFGSSQLSESQIGMDNLNQPAALRGLNGLSKRQKEVLLLVVQGLPNKVIAQRLGISEHTVKAHVSASFKWLGVRN
ncbi:MAG: response regulator transcription factor, partial [Pseudomonadota bacterium]